MDDTPRIRRAVDALDDLTEHLDRWQDRPDLLAAHLRVGGYHVPAAEDVNSPALLARHQAAHQGQLDAAWAELDAAKEAAQHEAVTS